MIELPAARSKAAPGRRTARPVPSSDTPEMVKATINLDYSLPHSNLPLQIFQPFQYVVGDWVVDDHPFGRGSRIFLPREGVFHVDLGLSMWADAAPGGYGYVNVMHDNPVTVGERFVCIAQGRMNDPTGFGTAFAASMDFYATEGTWVWVEISNSTANWTNPQTTGFGSDYDNLSIRYVGAAVPDDAVLEL